MRQPNYVPDRDQLLRDFHGECGGMLDDVAADAVSITVEEYLNPQDVRNTPSSPTDTILSSVSTLHNYWRYVALVVVLLCPASSSSSSAAASVTALG